MRTVVAGLVAASAVPAVFRVVLRFYVHGPVDAAVPLLPGIIAVIALEAYLVTFVIGVPVWEYAAGRGKATVLVAIAAGTGLGLLAGALSETMMPNWPLGLLLWSGGTGGATAGLLFRLIAGPRPNRMTAGALDVRDGH